MFLKFLAFLNPITGNFSKTDPCFLFVFNSVCILDYFRLFSRCISAFQKHRMILKTNLILFSICFCLFKTSNLKHFFALRICPLNNPLLYSRNFSHTPNSLHRLSKRASSGQILSRRKAWVKSIDFLQWQT